MDYAEITKNSAIVSVIEEQLDDGEETYTIVFRVLNDKKWRSMIQAMLKASHEDEEFGVTVRQEFYLNNEGVPAYLWSAVLWGDLESARVSLSPILQKRGAPPAPPKSVSSAIRTQVSTQQPAYRKQDGSVVKNIPLPFKRANSETLNKDEVVKVGNRNRKINAFVTTYSGQ